MQFCMDQATPSTSTKQSFITAACLVVCSIAIWWRPLLAACELALSDDAYTHILLILPLSLSLIYFSGATPRKDWPSTRQGGIALLAISLLLRIFAARNLGSWSQGDSLSLNIFSLVIWWIGTVVLCFGLQFLRLILFPACLLFLMVPFPPRLTTGIREFLQQQSAISATALFRLAWVPATRDGVVISIPGLDLEVAEECSSIRSSMMLLIITVVLAHLFLHAWWRKSLLILAAIPLAVAKNALRIVTIGELGTRVDPAFLTGRLHRNGGFLFLGLAVLLTVALLFFLRKREQDALRIGSVRYLSVEERGRTDG